MHLAEKIFELRKVHGLSQEQLAERLGISRQSVSKWEAGDSVPEPERLVEMSRFFNVTTDYLLKEEEERGQAMHAEMPGRRPCSKSKGMAVRRRAILGCAAVYLIALSTILIFRFTLFRFHEGIGLPGITGYIVILAAATAAAIKVSLQNPKNEN